MKRNRWCQFAVLFGLKSFKTKCIGSLFLSSVSFFICTHTFQAALPSKMYRDSTLDGENNTILLRINDIKESGRRHYYIAYIFYKFELHSHFLLLFTRITEFMINKWKKSSGEKDLRFDIIMAWNLCNKMVIRYRICMGNKL